MNRRTGSTRGALAGIGIALLLGGCGGQSGGTDSAPVAATGDPSVRIAFRTMAEPAKGENQVEAVVKTADGMPITDADVAVTFRMPAMPSMNMPEMHSTTQLAHVADGRYVGTGELEMGGTWNVVVTVSREDAPQASARFTLMAK